MKCSACGRSIQFDKLRCEACGHDMLPEDIARHLPEVPTAFAGRLVLAARPMPEVRTAAVLESREDAARLALASEAANEAMKRARWRVFPILAALVVLATLFLLARL